MSYGPEAIHDLIQGAGLSYPVSVSRVERQFRFENVQIDDHGTMILVSELLLDVDSNSFESKSDLERTLEPVMRAESQSRRVGVIGKVKRSLLGR